MQALLPPHLASWVVRGPFHYQFDSSRRVRRKPVALYTVHHISFEVGLCSYICLSMRVCICCDFRFSNHPLFVVAYLMITFDKGKHRTASSGFTWYHLPNLWLLLWMMAIIVDAMEINSISPQTNQSTKSIFFKKTILYFCTDAIVHFVY